MDKNNNTDRVVDVEDSNKLEIVDLYSRDDQEKGSVPFAQIATAGKRWMWYCDEPGGFALDFVALLVKQNNQQVVTRSKLDIPEDVAALGADAIIEYVRHDRNMADPAEKAGEVPGKEALRYLRKFAQLENGLTNLSKAVQQFTGHTAEQVEILTPLEQMKIVAAEILQQGQFIEPVVETMAMGM